MAGANTVRVQVIIDSDAANQNLDRTNKNIDKLGQSAAKASQAGAQGIKGFSVAVEQTSKSVDQLVEAFAGLATLGFAAKMIQTADAIRKVQISLEAMGGSIAQADQQMAALRDIAAKSPFAFTDLAEAARKMQAFGFAAHEVPGDIQAIAKAVALVGGNTETIDHLTHALGVMREKGVAQAQQLFRSIAAQGIPVMEILQKRLQEETGKMFSVQEVRTMMEKGRLAGEATAEAIIEGMKNLPETPAMMELPTSQIQKFKDEVGFLAVKIEQDVAPTLLKLIQLAKDLVEALGKIPKPVRDVAEALGGIAIGIGLIGSAKNIGLVTAFFGQVAAAGPALIALAAILTEKSLLEKFAAPREEGPWFLKPLPDWLSGKGAADWTKYWSEQMGRTFFPNMFGPEQGMGGVARPRPGFMGPQMGVVPGAGLPQLDLSQLDTARKKAKLLQDDIKLIEQQMAEANAILARAEEQRYKGIAAVEYKRQQEIAKMRTELGHPSPAEPLIQKAFDIEVETVFKEMREKRLEEEAKTDKEILDNRIAMTKEASRVQADLALSVVQDSPQKEAEAQIARLEIIKKYAEDERQLRNQQAFNAFTESMRRLRLEAGEQLSQANVTAAEKRRLTTEYVAQEKRIQADYNRETQKNAIDTAKETQDAIAEIVKEAARNTTQYLDQARQAEQNARIAHAERQADIERMRIETGEAQTARAKIEAIRTATEFEIAAAEHVAEVRKQIADENERRMEAGAQVWEDYFNSEGMLAEAQKMYNLRASMRDAYNQEEWAATEELEDKKIKLQLEGQRQVNEAWIAEQKEVFDKVQSGVSQVFDAMFERGKSMWQRLKDMMFTATKDILKAAIVPPLTAAIMTAGGMPVHMEQKGYYGEGWLANLMAITNRKPVFSEPPHLDIGPISKAHVDNGRLQVDARIVGGGTGPPAKLDITRHDNITIRGGGGLGNIPLLPQLQFPSGGGAGGGSLAEVVTHSISFPTIEGTTGGAVGGAGGGGFSLGQALIGMGALGAGGAGGGNWGGASGGGFSLGQTLIGMGALSGGGGQGGAAALAGLPLGGGGMSINNLVTVAASKGLLGGLKGGLGSLAGMAGPAAAMGGLMAMKGAYSLGQAMQNRNVPGAARGLMSGALGAFGGLLAAGGLAAMFPSIFVPLLAAGPVGWIAAAAIGATIGLIGAFKETDTAHARKLVKQMYGIDISNQGVLRQIVQIAKERYGGAISLAVSSPEVQQLVNLYAASQGMGAVGPRPMYGATFAQGQAGASGLQLQPTYSNGIVVANPYTGTTTQQIALASQNVAGGAAQSLFVQLDPQAAGQLFAGQVVNVINRNPTVVGNANSSAISSGSSRSDQLGGLLEPFTVHA